MLTIVAFLIIRFRGHEQELKDTFNNDVTLFRPGAVDDASLARVPDGGRDERAAVFDAPQPSTQAAGAGQNV